MKTAIIGLGAIGGALAKHLAAGGMEITVAERDEMKAQDFARELGALATAVSIETAAREADVIVLAIPFDAIKQFLLDHRAAIAGKVLIDPSNPIADDGKGGFKKTIPEDQSSGVAISRLAPEDAEVVKAFGSLAAPTLASAASRKPEKAVLFYATDFHEAGAAAERLIRASGFDPVSVGGIDQSLRIEVFGDLHEMGGLGKTVSVEEAKALLG